MSLKKDFSLAWFIRDGRRHGREGGIPEALQPLLFERFTKARRPGLCGEPTTGLGLALCKTIGDWHHGTLSVASAEGPGSTFTVELPQVV